MLAAQACRSIVPIIVVNEEGMGDRMSGLKKMSQNISHFFKNIEEDIDKFQFVFTKYINRPNENTPVAASDILMAQ